MWRFWGRPDRAKSLADRSEEVRLQAVRLHKQLLRTTSQLDEFVAALNTEVVRFQRAQEDPQND